MGVCFSRATTLSKAIVLPGSLLMKTQIVQLYDTYLHVQDLKLSSHILCLMEIWRVAWLENLLTVNVDSAQVQHYLPPSHNWFWFNWIILQHLWLILVTMKKGKEDRLVIENITICLIIIHLWCIPLYVRWSTELTWKLADPTET